jgi:hypothetical protein
MSIFQIAKKYGWKIMMWLTIPYLLILVFGNYNWWQVSEYFARKALENNPTVFTDISKLNEESRIITDNSLFNVFAASSQICDSATSGSMADSIKLVTSLIGDSKIQKIHDSIANLKSVCSSASNLSEQLSALSGLNPSQLQITPETIPQLNKSEMDDAILVLGNINRSLGTIKSSVHELNVNLIPLVDNFEALGFFDPDGSLSQGLHSWEGIEDQISTFMSEVERNRQTLIVLNGAYIFGSFMERFGITLIKLPEEFINNNFHIFTKILLIAFCVWIGGLVGDFLEQQFHRRDQLSPRKVIHIHKNQTTSPELVYPSEVTRSTAKKQETVNNPRTSSNEKTQNPTRIVSQEILILKCEGKEIKKFELPYDDRFSIGSAPNDAVRLSSKWLSPSQLIFYRKDGIRMVYVRLGARIARNSKLLSGNYTVSINDKFVFHNCELVYRINKKRM